MVEGVKQGPVLVGTFFRGGGGAGECRWCHGRRCQ